MNKKQLISKERYKQRISICLDCPSYQKKFNRCIECGCLLIIKAALRDTKCPLNEWPNGKQNNDTP